MKTFNDYLEEVSSSESILRKLPFSRKPSSFEDFSKSVVNVNRLTNEQKNALKEIQKYTFEDLFDTDDVNFATDDFYNEPEGIIFILEHNGDEYLCNTEGYSYIRYVLKLQKN